ncbi:MAG: magnesium transporter CorA family protein [Candidatus Eisenbacteria bacterium]|nr:magnesium transporter CorA family protein [Candidatus Eisenbacteria bacterium]
MLKHYRIVDGLIVRSPDPGQIAVYVMPNEEEIRELVDVHKIDRHNVDSSVDPDEIGRMELDVETEQVAMIVKRPRYYSSSDQFLFRVMSMGVFLFPSKMIIVIADDTTIFEGKYLVRMKTLHDVLIKLIYSTIAHFSGHLKVINMISEELEQKINKSMENKFLLDMFVLEKSLVYFLNALNDNATIIGKLKLNAGKIGFSPDNVEVLDDLMIDNSQCLTLTQTYSNILSSLMDARASVVSNNLNVMMKNLNAVVIAVAVPSFVAGMGGMSEFSEITGIARWYVAYPVFAGAMMLLGVVTFFTIRSWERRWR